jgi:hypothetical protein
MAVTIGLISIIYLQSTSNSDGSNLQERQRTLELLSDITPINISQQGKGNLIPTSGNPIFDVFYYSGDLLYNEKELPSTIVKQYHFLLKSENTELYQEIGVGAEQHNSECGTECLNDIPIRYESRPTFESSANTIKVLRLLGYPYITDIEIDKNPSILELFDKVILLHNEYVTYNEFEAITKHPKVIYLHPNALYAQIEVDYEKESISLIRGHNYPSAEIKNGFEWKFDNTYPFEYDTDCEDWDFIPIDNGIMLNCYPENIIFQDEKLLKAIKEY